MPSQSDLGAHFAAMETLVESYAEGVNAEIARGVFMMGIGWLWLVDVERKTIEVFSNERGRMIAGPALEARQALAAPPFGDLSSAVEDLFLI